MGLADKLRVGDGMPRIAEYEGQTLTVLSYEIGKASFGTSYTVTAVNSNGDEVQFYATPYSGSQLEAIEDDLPAELKVVSFPSAYGKKGYALEEPGDAE